MKFPSDWDKPSEDNIERCKLFKYGEFKGTSLKYRFFVPERAGGEVLSDSHESSDTKLPLVLYLHGADGFGKDNESQLTIHDIGTFLVDERVQSKYPCLVLAPQTSGSMHWSVPSVRKSLQELVESFAKSNNVDTNRIYVYGYSAGGAGTLGLIKEYPEFYAAAISICGATSGNGIERLKETPLYMVHALDDIIVQASYGYDDSKKGKFSHYGSKDIWRRFNGTKGYDLQYDEYPELWMKEHYNANAHCTWVIVSDFNRNERILKWLFSHKRK